MHAKKVSFDINIKSLFSAPKNESIEKANMHKIDPGTIRRSK